MKTLSISYILALILVGGSLFVFLRNLLNKQKEATGLPTTTQPVMPARFPVFSGLAKPLLIAALLVIFAFWSPYLFKGENTHVKIFDNLDCHMVDIKVLAESGKAFSLNPHTKIDNFLNGLNLSGVDSGYNVLTWLFMLFPPFVAYALNDLIMRLVAFFGMIMVLRAYLLRQEGEERQFIVMGAALCFSLVPFYPAGGLSVAGLPLLLYAFLNIRSRCHNWRDYLIIFIYPFYAKLALVGVFVGFFMFIMLVVESIKQRRVHFPFFGGLALFTVTFLFTHFHLVYSFIDPTFTSFREEIRAQGMSLIESLKSTIHNFIFDRVNEVSAQHLFVIGAAALAVVLAAGKKIKINLLTAFVAMTLFTSFMWGFRYWNWIMPLREKFQLINAFDMSRFFWFNPFLWYVIFALALMLISRIKWGKVVAVIFICGQVLYMFANYNWEYRHMLGVKTSFAGARLTYSLTYKEYYSPALFREIADYIGRPQKEYRVASIGMPPAPSQFNGFYTLDIYTDVFSLDYKHKFRKIIAKELAKNKRLKISFDENCKRCYILPAELHKVKVQIGWVFNRGLTKQDNWIKIKNLELDTAAFKALGGEYILSAVEIRNYAENGFEFEKVFERADSPWKIYLYRAL